MILVDTSVWIDHLRHGDHGLGRLLEANEVCTHEFVIGELACGNLRARDQVLGLLQSLRTILTADAREVLFLVDRHCLMGRGIGYVDAHLLAAAAADGSTQLWTRDKRLHAVCGELGIAYQEPVHWSTSPQPDPSF